MSPYCVVFLCANVSLRKKSYEFTRKCNPVCAGETRDASLPTEQRAYSLRKFVFSMMRENAFASYSVLSFLPSCCLSLSMPMLCTYLRFYNFVSFESITFTSKQSHNLRRHHAAPQPESPFCRHSRAGLCCLRVQFRSMYRILVMLESRR